MRLLRRLGILLLIVAAVLARVVVYNTITIPDVQGEPRGPIAATAEFREAIRLQPDDTYAHTSLGVALGRLGKLDQAIAEQHEAIRIRPDNAYVHESLGWTLREQGKLDEAIVEYREAIRQKPGLA